MVLGLQRWWGPAVCDGGVQVLILNMGKDKAGSSSQQPKMDKYTVPGTRSRSLERGATAADTGSDRFSEILAAIQVSRSALEGQIGGVQAKVSLVHQDLRNVVDRVTEVEGRVSELEDTVKGLGVTVRKLEAATGALEARAEDAENRVRRNNIRFIGIPEGLEGTATESFLEQWLRSWVPSHLLSPCFVLERAHRSLQRRPPLGAPPRPMIVKILNYKDCDAILQQAREVGEVKHENSRIIILPDYSIQVQRGRKSYDAVKQKLRSMGLTYTDVPLQIESFTRGQISFLHYTTGSLGLGN